MFLGFCGRAQLKLQTWFGIVFLAMSNICCSVACHLLGCTHWALSALWLVLDSEFWVLGPGTKTSALQPTKLSVIPGQQNISLGHAIFTLVLVQPALICFLTFYFAANEYLSKYLFSVHSFITIVLSRPSLSHVCPKLLAKFTLSASKYIFSGVAWSGVLPKTWLNGQWSSFNDLK